MELNKLVFPAPQASYDNELPLILDEPGHLIYIPKPKIKKDQTFFFTSDEEIKQETPFKINTSSSENKKIKYNGFIPCLYLPYKEGVLHSNILMIFFHGNAEDIYLAYDLLRNLKKELKV